MRWLLVLLAVAACKKKPAELGDDCSKTPCERGLYCVLDTCRAGVVGDKCTGPNTCRPENDCFERACRAPASLGQSCKGSARCEKPLTCLNDTCASPAEVARYEAKLEADKKREEAAREQRMLEQSGVETPVVAELAPTTASPPGAGTRVRTVTVASTGTAFAACKATERLIGGGCKTKSLKSSYPSGQSAEDTIGARWNCEGNDNNEVMAYALCTKP